ncbi:MAG: hypothetical protein R3B48_27385 [Kofleriaceae bacterium]
MHQRGSSPLLAAALLGLVAACAKDVVTSFSVEVAVVGNEAPATVELTWDEGTELLELGPDASVAFRQRLTAGQVVRVQGPAECKFTNRDSSISLTTEEDETHLALACPGVLDLGDLAPSRPVLEARDALAIELTLPALLADPAPSVDISPSLGYPGTELTLNGAILSGEGSVTGRLNLGRNTLQIASPEHGLARSYSLMLQRAANARELIRVAGAVTGGALGTAIAADGDVVAIGEPGANGGAGRVLIYRREGAQWSQEAILTPAVDAGADSGFGSALALVGDALAVGSPKDDYVAADTGAVYVFTRQAGAWGVRRRIHSALINSRYGTSVAISPGGVLAVGSPNEISGRGKVYLYDALGDIPDSARVQLVATAPGDGDAFGSAVAFAGGNLIVSAPGEDSGSATSGTDNSQLDSGAIYLFTFATTWTQTAYRKALPSPTAGAEFGKLLSAQGDTVVASWHVGGTGGIECYRGDLTYRYAISAPGGVAALSAHGDRVAFSTSAGGGALRATAYRLGAAAAAQMVPPFTGSGAAGADGFAGALALQGDRLHLGASLQGAQGQGAFYVFE